jgi:arylsulfatase A-like enzyme
MRLFLTFLSAFAFLAGARAEKPNIIWIFAEDTSPWMGCYGSKVNADATPNIDSLASSGVRFSRAFVPAPVCSACRSAMMGGQSQIRFGAHEHRSSRGVAKIQLPAGMKLLPQIMKENGYFTFNHGKTDYNFIWDLDATYSKAKLKGKTDSFGILKQHQPFFGQFQTKGGKNNTTKFPATRKVDPAKVTVPPDYPQNQIYREVVAQHHDAIRKDDDLIGEIMAGLKAAGMADNTIVVYFSDHGANHLVRHKQMPTEGGLHVPFIITGPKKYVPRHGVRNDLVDMLDLSATTLAWAGIDQPSWYEGQYLFGANFKERTFVASGKDRLDHTLDRVRTVRTDRFRYTRNYKLDRIFLQPQYRDRQAYVKNLRELYASGELPAKLKEIYFGERPAEELYDVTKDPHQLHNLAADPKFAAELNRHRGFLTAWMAKGDMGVGEEPIEEMRENADDKKWGHGVNPEYEVYRADHDGDGLSDKWEQVNGRNPQDGLIQFEFDCGGWQTEGWEPDGIKDNIAGALGFLDFKLPQWKGSLRRDGLNATAMAGDQALLVRLRASAPLRVQAFANATKLGGELKAAAGKEYTTLRVPLKNQPGWKGHIKSLQLDLFAKKGTLIEIDSIVVERN